MNLVQQFKDHFLQEAKYFSNKENLTLLKSDNAIYVIADFDNGNIISNEVEAKMTTALFPHKEEKVFITLFDGKEEFSKLSDKISWDTYVWIATEPNHTIHFDNKPKLKPRKSRYL